MLKAFNIYNMNADVCSSTPSESHLVGSNYFYKYLILSGLLWQGEIAFRTPLS